MYGEIVVFSGNANPGLAERVCNRMGVPLGEARVGRFSDGEIRVEIEQNVRGRDVFLIQPTCAPANDNLMELLIMTEACQRASAGRVTAVMPYYGYARQDRKVAPRAPISAKLVAQLIQAAGVDRVLTMDLHAGQIQGFFDIPVDNLYALPVLLRHLRDNLMTPEPSDTVIVSPDAGGVERARAFARRIGAGLAIIDKRRPGPNELEIMHIIGDVVGKTAVIVDDMIDTGGTLVKGGEAVKNAGASRVYAMATHAVLSGSAYAKIAESSYEKVLVTDTIPHANPGAMVETLTVAALFAEAIRAIHFNDSISKLFLTDGS
jgi:ribose-phosphate pyrophosphokinase